MNGRQEIESRREQIEAICRQHKVARLLVFGSVLRDDFNPDTSDIDFLVDFLPDVHKGWMWEFTELKNAFEEIFKRRVDVIPERGIKNRIVLKYVEREKELLYAA